MIYLQLLPKYNCEFETFPRNLRAFHFQSAKNTGKQAQTTAQIYGTLWQDLINCQRTTEEIFVKSLIEHGMCA